MFENNNNAVPTLIREWNDSLEGDYLWSNVNFGEAVTEVMTPLTASVIRFTLDDWIFLPGRSTVGVIGGRPYLNISVFATLFYGLGCSRDDLLRFLESTLYMRLPDDMPIPSIAVSRGTFLRALFAALKVQRKQQHAVQEAPAYVKANKAWFEGIRQTIESQASESGLYNLWQAEMRPHIKAGVWCVLGSASHSADYTLKLRRELVALLGPEDADVLIANLSEGDAPLESLGPVAALEKVAEGTITRAAYLEHYGHRGPHEFELSVPRPAEDRAWLDRELERLRRSPLGVQTLMAGQRSSYESAWKRLLSVSPRAANGLRRKLAESARRARLRELNRSAYVRDRWAIRLFAIRAGELTGLADQVFYLTLDELLALLSGERSVTQAIEPRRKAYLRYRALPSYPPVIRGPFDPFAWAADPDRPTDVFDASRPVASGAASDSLAGSPGSAGVVEGRVRVIKDPQDGDLLQPGEILVAMQTDIAFQPMR